MMSPPLLRGIKGDLVAENPDFICNKSFSELHSKSLSSLPLRKGEALFFCYTRFITRLIRKRESKRGKAKKGEIKDPNGLSIELRQL